MTELLPTIWYVAVGLLWFGFILLDGFDLGVGMRMLFGNRDERKRRMVLNAIGPFWDGNEVWLITAIGAMFAAFPFWYASLLSGSYFVCLFIIIGLILRAVGIEYRSKVHTTQWRAWCTRSVGVGSGMIAFGIGGLLGLVSFGLPIDAHGDSYETFAWFSPGFILAGISVLGFSLVHGAAFIALKTNDSVKNESHQFISRWSIVLLVPFLAWVAAVLWQYSPDITIYTLIPLSALVIAVWISNALRRDGLTFSLLGVFLFCAFGAILMSQYPNVLPSTIDNAHNLTVMNASSSPYTLSIMSIVALFGLPIVITYQVWTYWVFRHRLSDKDIPIVKLFKKSPHDTHPKP